MAKTKQKKKKRHLTKGQQADAKKSAKKHGRSKPGLWENVNASKGKGPKASKGKTGKKSAAKGKTRPGKRNRKSTSKGKKKS